MSFSAKVKEEICRETDFSKEEARAILSGVMKVSGTLAFTSHKQLNFRITTENAGIARFIFKILKEYFNMRTQLMVKKNNSLKKSNMYMVVISEEMGARELLEQVGIFKVDDKGTMSISYGIEENIINTDKNKKAYIKGAFLGGGSVSNPEKAYHMEFVTHDLEYANSLSKIINDYNLASKVIQRKNSYIVYLKEGEQISDVLSVVGAYNSLLEFENIRIMKEMRNNVNRLVNCETANLSKTVNAAVRQVESIKFIEKEIGFGRLPRNLQEIAELRLKHPDESLKELGAMLNPPVGKSGINHRLRRIEKIADELRKEGR